MKYYDYKCRLQTKELYAIPSVEVTIIMLYTGCPSPQKKKEEEEEEEKKKKKRGTTDLQYFDIQ